MIKSRWLICIIFMCASPILAQIKDGAVTLPESLTYKSIRISEFKLTGNRLTKDWYIIRELDFVTYYDRVLRFEYAFTSEHTNGFIIAFGMPI